MVKQTNCHLLYPCGLDKLCLIVFLALVLILVACSPTAEPTTGPVIRSPQPTPTSEPTFTPSPPPTNTPIPPPTDTPTPEPTLTPTPEQANLSGRIFDQDTNQPIAEAQVSAGTASTTTDTNGGYTLTGLPPGQYILSISHPDYDPGLSRIFTLVGGQELFMDDLTLYALDTSPYPKDPMLTNPLDPNGAPTEADAIRLAQEQGLTSEVVNIEETTLTGEYLVNYKIGDEVRAAVAEINHDVWELTDEAGRKWWIIKVCGNLASSLPGEKPIPTPKPTSLPLMAEVVVDELIVQVCTSDECVKVGTVPREERVEVFGCLADNSWCEVSWSGGRGWCTGQSLRQLAVATVIPRATPFLPTPTPVPTVIPTIVPPEEAKIIFNSVRDGEGGYYIINVDGSGLETFTELHRGYGDWSPDGNRVVFSHENDIYVMNADGSGLTNLTNHPASYSDPIWSSDGRQILFRSNRDDPDPENCIKRLSVKCNYEIYVMNTDGSGLTNLTNDPGSDEDHAWLPDGRIIFFRSGSIYVMNADGSGIQRLIEGSWPLLSPDGSRFVFFSRDPFGLLVMSINDSNLIRLTDQQGTYSKSQIAWSPDGQKIAFGAILGSGDDTYQIYIVNADGSNFTRLTNRPGLNSQPAWSPDGQKIAFVSTRDGNDELYVMNADGSEQTRLTDRPDFHDIFPRWSR